MTAKTFSLSTAILACCSTQALADSECGKGFRDTTAAERTAMTDVLTTALAALPAPPTGWIVTTDEIADPKRLTLVTRLNGQEVQKSGTDLLIHSVPQIIAFCSDFTPLAPGDVIATGTPEGVGHRRNPQLWMKPGDVLEVEISGVGTLRSRVVDEK